MISIHELQVFLAAAETENFSEAGRRLGISQPAVSMQIRSLENRLDTRLFVRAGRHISLSETGNILVPLARELVDRAIQIEEMMISMQGEVIGLLKLGCSTTAGKYILPRLFAGLRELHPRVDITCDVTTRELTMNKLLEGETHIALTSLRENYKNIEYRPFLADRLVLIVPIDHPWAQSRQTVTPGDLLTQNFILREESSGTYEALQEGLSWHELNLSHFKTVMTLGNSEAIRIAVQEGIGVAFVSSIVAYEAVQNGTLAMIEVEGLELTKTLYMARHTGRPATRAQAAFWEYAFAPENETIRQRPTLFISGPISANGREQSAAK